MDVRRMDALSDWDDWEDEPEWWLRHPLHRPQARRSTQSGGPKAGARKFYPQRGEKSTIT
jgi:hypothetical protein